jgi:hypothetical protein
MPFAEGGRLQKAVATGSIVPKIAQAAPALPVVQARSALAGTSLALDVPKGAALPFATPPGGGAAGPGRLPGAVAAGLPAPKVAQGPALPVVQPRSVLAGTSLALDVPKGPALPFAGLRPNVERPPSPESTTPASNASPLTLEHHASLCCELAVAPERAAETLARYRVTPAEKQAADRHYGERFVREPGLREAWDRAYQVYRTWWIESTRRGT